MLVSGWEDTTHRLCKRTENTLGSKWRLRWFLQLFNIWSSSSNTSLLYYISSGLFQSFTESPHSQLSLETHFKNAGESIYCLPPSEAPYTMKQRHRDTNRDGAAVISQALSVTATLTSQWVTMIRSSTSQQSPSAEWAATLNILHLWSSSFFISPSASSGCNKSHILWQLYYPKPITNPISL